MAGNEIAQIQDSLADRFCARRDLYCLFRFLPAYFAPNGLTDGWEERRTALGEEALEDADDIKDLPDAILAEAAQITADLVQVEPRLLARAKPAG